MKLLAIAFVALTTVTASAKTSQKKHAAPVHHRGKTAAARALESHGHGAKHAHPKGIGSPDSSLAQLAMHGHAAASRPTMPHFQGPVTGQSLGYPWSGKLQEASQLEEGDGYVIRRPARAFGTAPAVAIIQKVLTDIVAEFPENHVLGVGDISAEHGGAITQHASHQAGRDVDMGLYYVEKPTSYPEEFINATEDNLDSEATYALIDKFAKTTKQDGGVMMMFLDYEVQGILYRWAKDHGIEDDHLARLLQYPRGKGADAIVRHYPNHANHFHVRFKCPSDDSGCR